MTVKLKKGPKITIKMYCILLYSLVKIYIHALYYIIKIDDIFKYLFYAFNIFFHIEHCI